MQSNSAMEWIAAIAAAVSALGSLIALLIAKRTLRDSGTSADAAKVSAEASKKSADATVESLAVAKESVEVSRKSLEISERNAVAAEDAVKLSRDLFSKQSATELHNATSDIGIIDKTNPDRLIVWRAVNAMDLIATHWKFDITDKKILTNSYWELYAGWYTALDSINNVIDPFQKTGKAMLTQDLREVYREMAELVKNQAP